MNNPNEAFVRLIYNSRNMEFFMNKARVIDNQSIYNSRNMEFFMNPTNGLKYNKTR